MHEPQKAHVLLVVCMICVLDCDCCRMELAKAKKIAEEKKREKLEERLARYTVLLL